MDIKPKYPSEGIVEYIIGGRVHNELPIVEYVLGGKVYTTDLRWIVKSPDDTVLYYSGRIDVWEYLMTLRWIYHNGIFYPHNLCVVQKENGELEFTGDWYTCSLTFDPKFFGCPDLETLKEAGMERDESYSRFVLHFPEKLTHPDMKKISYQFYMSKIENICTTNMNYSLLFFSLLARNASSQTVDLSLC